MSPTHQAIFNEALSLPPVERASLIEELLASFDISSRRSIDAAWGLKQNGGLMHTRPESYGLFLWKRLRKESIRDEYPFP